RTSGTEMLEHREAFIQTLRAGPHVRKSIFDTLEACYAEDFKSGRMGRKVYDVLYSAVRDADEPDALKEFENRFLPLLTQATPPRNAKGGSAATAGEDQTTTDYKRFGGWAGALGAVALVVSGLAVGLVVLNTLVPDPPTRMKSAGSRAQVTEPIRTITEVEPPPAIH